MHWGEVNWRGGIFLFSYHILLLILLPLYLTTFTPSIGLIATMLALVAVTNLGITTAYHRLYAHRSFRANTLLEPIFLLFGTLAFQMSVIEWSHDHRLHHRFVDTEKDPYSVKKGFWHAHFFWMLKKRPEFDPNKTVPDLMANKLVAWQHKHYISLVIFLNLVVVFGFGFLFADLFGAFVFLFLFRLFISHHTTWLINSAAHYWGAKPYSKEHTAVNNWLIALPTFGEGYHNYHHTFPSDYRNGVRWYQWDPTKVIIWGLSKLGLTSRLIKVNKLAMKRRLLQEDKKLLLESLRASPRIEAAEQKIKDLYTQIQQRISDAHGLLLKYKALRAQNAHKDTLRPIKAQLRALKKTLRQDLKVWGRMCNQILRKTRVSV